MSCPHLNLLNPDVYRDGIPHDHFAQLRKERPVYWQDDPLTGVGYWVVTKYDDLQYISKHPEIFSSAERTALATEMSEEEVAMQRIMMLNMDPPDHLKYRRIVNKAFIPKVVEEKLAHIRDMAKTIVDAVAQRGECEFVSEVAAELPLQVICELMGVAHDDRHMIFHNTNIMIGADDPDLSTTADEGMMAAAEIYTYGYKILENHRKHPGNNLIDMLVTGTVDGEQLSDDEFAQFFLLLLVAGNETTRTVTANGMKLLIEHPEQHQELIDNPSLIPNAIEEFLRYEPAVMQFRRTTKSDVELGGQQMKKGDKVVMYYTSANRDEDYFNSPDVFDIHRDNAKEHRSFGIGEHFCLGSHLARLELRVMFEEIIPRLRNPRFAEKPNYMRSAFLNSMKTMPITFDPETA
ncbi:cytochrome P450 [Litorivivens sp.]|uniref:cytochrome P450 n=2 Tax=Litorivivens sp. TaxID=2020868 RepID=UPI0035625395